MPSARETRPIGVAWAPGGDKGSHYREDQEEHEARSFAESVERWSRCPGTARPE